jgi:hypothetical protein
MEETQTDTMTVEMVSFPRPLELGQHSEQPLADLDCHCHRLHDCHLRVDDV